MYNPILHYETMTTSSVNNSESSYIGLMQIGECLVEQAYQMEMELNARELTDEDRLEYDWCECEIIRTYREAMHIHESLAQSLAVYYEKQHYPSDVIEEHYQRAIAHDDNAGSMINLADYYKVCGNIQSMVQLLGTAVYRYKNSYSCVMLALHYAKRNDKETTQMYYELALAYRCHDSHLLIDTMTEPIELIRLTEFIHDGGWSQNNHIYDEIQRLCNTNASVRYYYTKVRLFTSLNHIAECGVCCNLSLHLDFRCGHCVCSDCYLRLLGSACPFCRESIEN